MLAELSFEEVVGGSTLLLSSATISSGAADVLLTDASASAEVPACDADDCGICNGDNSSCLDCAGVPNGDAVVDNCGDCNGDNACYEGSLSLGAFDADAGTLDIMYDFGAPVAGFQFDLTGLALAGGTGGAAGDAGFDVQAGGSTVLGFSFTGDAIPAGSGLLTVLSPLQSPQLSY